MAESLRLAGVAIKPVMPATSDKIYSVLGISAGADWNKELHWSGILTGSKVAESLVLFPRPQPAQPTQAAPKK